MFVYLTRLLTRYVWLSEIFVYLKIVASDKGRKSGVGGGDKKDRGKSPRKSALTSGKKTPDASSAKGGSKLRKRGEEEDDGKSISE